MGASQSAAATGGASPGKSLEAAHAALLRDRDLQFDLPRFKAPDPHLFDWAGFFQAIAPALKVIFWGGLAVVAVMIAVFILREVTGLRALGRHKARRAAATPVDWRPDAARARVLLEDADRLADEGRFAEAAHLLLLRGVEDIQHRRPRLVAPALTSRDIAASPDLPEPARPAFAAIAQVVERSLFGGRPVDRPAWSDCRRAYESLVFAETWS